MLTQSDKKFILDSISENNKIIFKEMVDLFSTTNERIDRMEERLSDNVDEVKNLGNKIDKALDELKDHNDILNNHEQRLDKVEDKVFVTTTSP